MILVFLGFKPTHQKSIYLKKIRLGDSTVVIRRESYGPGKVFVHLHANELTALKAARLVAHQQGGQVVTLVHDQSRDIYFKYHGRHYAFDPNRIFTRQGRIKTLKQHHCYHANVERLLAHLAQQILINIPAGMVVAVHNNKDYSLKDYLPHHKLHQDAKYLFRARKNHFRNFFLVTQEQDFKRYRKLGFNVVYQAPHAIDDGSLSIIFAKKNYVNVEAGFNQLKQQQRMLEKA
jgi:hypothetical protein